MRILKRPGDQLAHFGVLVTVFVMTIHLGATNWMWYLATGFLVLCMILGTMLNMRERSKAGL